MIQVTLMLLSCVDIGMVNQVEETPNDVEKLGGITREKALFSELNNIFINLSIQHASLLSEATELLNSEYLVDNDLKADLRASLDAVIDVYNQIKNNLKLSHTRNCNDWSVGRYTSFIS